MGMLSKAVLLITLVASLHYTVATKGVIQLDNLTFDKVSS